MPNQTIQMILLFWEGESYLATPKKAILAIGVCYILDMVIVWKQYPRQEFENETAKFEAAFLKHAQKHWMHTYVLHFSNADTLHVYFEAIWSIPYDQKYRNIYLYI